MMSKDYFRRIRELKSLIKSKEIQSASLRDLAVNINPNYSVMPKNPSKSASPMEEVVCKALDLESETNELKKRLISMEIEAIDLINEISDANYQALLTRRYIRMENWEDIARELYYSQSTVYRVHREAVAAFDAVLERHAI